ncbi:MAG: sigma-70 family RNA polymerase sigma factor [Oscillochloris sp.]|nr:sigma-70 family RNA polymerase sigma factor [Oscillochloris sp.]
MDHAADFFQRCTEVIAQLAQKEGWGLSPADVEKLAEFAYQYVQPSFTETHLQKLILTIQRDRATVEALHHYADARHQSEWKSWMGQAQAILQSKNLYWARDTAVDIDDLTQIALLELTRSLPTFRYQSRFSTWAYQVIIGGVRRHLRDMAARKRNGDIDPSVDPEMVEIALGVHDLPETHTWASMLSEAVYRELAAALGQRNADIFSLWACHDLSAEMIGQRFGLSTTRVHALLKQAREYLRNCASIQAWREVPGE